MRSCDRPSNSSASTFCPSSVSNVYSFSTGTHGSSCRCFAISSSRAPSSCSRSCTAATAAVHSSRVPTLCFVIFPPPSETQTGGRLQTHRSSRDRLSDCPPQHDLERPVELGPCLFRQVVPLPRPCQHVRERAHADREREGALEAVTPGLQIRVAQPREPRVGRRQLVELFEEAERDDERCEGVRDRRVAPVEQAQPRALRVEVPHVEVVVLNRLRQAVCGELAA